MVGMTVTPPDDDHSMSKQQLRLVEAPEPPRTARARATKAARGRRVHWATDWRLDTKTRSAGRAGVAEARKALAAARRPETTLRQAS
jgi:hypothetical protein